MFIDFASLDMIVNKITCNIKFASRCLPSTKAFGQIDVYMWRWLVSRVSQFLSCFQEVKALRKAKRKNLVIPSVKKQGSGDNTFEGATVLEAKTGFYEKPIATLDFTSLYPSIMMAYNPCYCNLVTPEDVCKFNLPPKCVNKTPSSETFVKSNLQKGILPEILEELLAARKRAKPYWKKQRIHLRRL
ncbi:hypothetical protein IFM89_032233 [Coptis chinensis]|uniref:DNA-directed DNA polymerase n=1 Tax=Coptis chinensis TaxID=261450 RepID=A0A835LW26_9MAGN|nr:hypothetical protein IFM89_032233 [Coptis chinensis]